MFIIPILQYTHIGCRVSCCYLKHNLKYISFLQPRAMVKISNAVNGNNSTTQSNVEGKKVLTASSNGSSHTGSTSRSNSATRRSNQNGDEKSGRINRTKLHIFF